MLCPPLKQHVYFVQGQIAYKYMIRSVKNLIGNKTLHTPYSWCKGEVLGNLKVWGARQRKEEQEISKSRMYSFWTKPFQPKKEDYEKLNNRKYAFTVQKVFKPEKKKRSQVTSKFLMLAPTALLFS